MATDLSTTNAFLGVIAAVSVLEALAVIGLFVGGYLLFRRLMQTISAIEERQVAPAAARVNAILDDVKGVTSTVKEEADRVERVVRTAADVFGRCRSNANGPVPH